jgi:peptidoglycan-N-acetylglucosamine deacetylase
MFVSVERGFPWARVLFAGALLGAMALCACVALGRPVPWWALTATLALLLIAVGSGVFIQGAGLFARPILAARGKDQTLALTFDDGPDPVHTRAVLDVLDRGGHKATFFVIGARAEKSPELLDEIVRRGHALANHSYTHAHSTPFWAVDRLAADLERAQQVLGRAMGKPPRWFRAPIGILSPRVVQAARKAGLTLVGWSATARDGVASATVESATQRLLRALRPGAILVLHDAAERGGRAPIAPQVLARVIEAMDARGLKSVTLDHLLERS